MKRKLLALLASALFLVSLAPAPAHAAGVGGCWVVGYAPASRILYNGTHVVTGLGRNNCNYPASVFTVSVDMQKRHCWLWECWYSTYYHGPVKFASPGGYTMTEFITAPWHGSGRYRVLVNGGCYNCYVPYGSDYGPSIYL